jgi:hypothetical protein
MTCLLTCSLNVLGSLIRCSTNSMSYLFFSHPPLLPSSYAPQDNSNYHTLVNLVPSAHFASALSSLACSTRAVSGIMPTWVHWTDGRPCWISWGWVRLVKFHSLITVIHLSLRRPHRIYTITHAASSARSSHHHSFSCCHDYRVRSYIRARGDQCGHSGHPRPYTFSRSPVHRPAHSSSA